MEKKFKATYGFDASGKKVVNMAKADSDSMTDGVNVEYFIENNTIQLFNQLRDYPKDFVIVYQNKIYKSKIEVQKGVFRPAEWERIRVDTEWKTIDQTASSGETLSYGDSILANSKFNSLSFNLPITRVEGESVVIRDIGYMTGINPITVSSSNGDIVLGNSAKSTRYISTPGIVTIFTYSRGAWYVNTTSPSRRYFVNSGQEYNTQTGDVVYKNTATGLITLTLPRYANDGDVITLFDVDKQNPKTHTLVKTHALSNQVINGGTQARIRTSGVTRLIYKESSNVWVIWTGDLRDRVKTTSANSYNVEANESIFVKCRTGTANYTTVLNLPTDAANGDYVRLSIRCTRKNQTVIIRANAQDTIVRNLGTLEYPRYTGYPETGANWETTSEITITKDNYSPFIELFYNSEEKLWNVLNYTTSIERVDANDKSRLGVIQLATTEEAQVDKDLNPNREKAITPETLSKRTATESRQGIARLATTIEVNKLSTDVYDDLTIITPKKLNERTATEDRRGLAEIGTQVEVNSNDNDLVIITPKKLNERTATEDRRGVIQLTALGGVSGASRTAAGTGVYDFNDNSKGITAKSLNQRVATENALGLGYIATESEVTSRIIPDVDPLRPLIVTTQTLDKKIAREDRKGISQIATQAEILDGLDDFKFVTPKKLKISQEVFVRKAGDQMTGKLVSDSPILPKLPEMPETELPTEPTTGFWVSYIKDNIALYPRAKIYGSNDYSTTGTLTNFGSDINSVTQIWSPTKGNKKYIRSGDSNGFGPFDEIYTKNNRPTAEEVGAISDSSGVLESMIVRDRFQIGNVVFKVNQATRSLDFIWLDDPLL